MERFTTARCPQAEEERRLTAERHAELETEKARAKKREGKQRRATSAVVATADSDAAPRPAFVPVRHSSPNVARADALDEVPTAQD